MKSLVESQRLKKERFLFWFGFWFLRRGWSKKMRLKKAHSVGQNASYSR